MRYFEVLRIQYACILVASYVRLFNIPVWAGDLQLCIFIDWGAGGVISIPLQYVWV